MKLIKEKYENVAVVTLTGEVLDANTVSEFKSEINNVIQSEYHVVFDMSKVNFVDSSGIGAILSCLRKLNSEGGDLKICALTKPVRALFELVRMHKIFDIFNTLDEALVAF
ncbi:MAG: STAS domain-containing protein [Pyrinomonadaceae bacterium]|nr:STAS domain-containing protein [Pyrinomonadaceae bacterium]